MSDDAASTFDTDLLFLLSWASRALATEQTARLSGLGITPRAYCALMKAQPGTLTQRQLADACGLDKSTMVLVIDELEKKGLVERSTSAKDRRIRIIRVTPKGGEVLISAGKIVSETQDDVLATLPRRQQQALMTGLFDLVTNRLSSFADCAQPPRRPGTRSGD